MINPTIATLIATGKESDIVAELDPEKADHYGIPDFLWSRCLEGGAWLPPVIGQNWSPRDI